MTSRIMTMPRMPPVRITQSFGDIATATRIESMANTMSVSSTFTTVAQNARQARATACALRRRPAVFAALTAPKKCVYDQVQQVAGADQLHPAELDQVDGEQRRDGAERERADDAVAQRLLLLRFGKAEHQDRQHHRVVGAQQAFERDQQADGDEVGRLRTSMREPRASILLLNVDTCRIKAYTWIGARFEVR